MNIYAKAKRGFTLVELLVVVAIIAIIGAGVAVTYRNMTEKAAIAMEISDCAILQKAISHWSAVNNGKLPNHLDLLADTDGNFYSKMRDDDGKFGMNGQGSWNRYDRGLWGPIGYTAMLRECPPPVLDALRSAGLTIAYRHVADAPNANDSTFTTNMMKSGVDVKDTILALENVPQKTLEAAAAVRDFDWPEDNQVEVGGTRYPIDSDHPLPVLGWTPLVGPFEKSAYTSKDQWLADKRIAEALLGSRGVNGDIKLAFVYPGGGARMMGMDMPMNLTQSLISTVGLTPEDVAVPDRSDWTQDRFSGKWSYTGKGRYFLVVMGLGRFASVFGGKAVRVDLPAYGKREAQKESVYSRYLLLIRVPASGYDTATGVGEKASVAAVLTPQGYTAAALRDYYIAAEENLKD